LVTAFLKNKKAVETPRDLPRLVLVIYSSSAARKPLLRFGLPPPVVQKRNTEFHDQVLHKSGRPITVKNADVNKNQAGCPLQGQNRQGGLF
jgi:hypothetical protein